MPFLDWFGFELASHYFYKIRIESGYFGCNFGSGRIFLGVFSKFFCFYFEDANKACIEVLDVFVHGCFLG